MFKHTTRATLTVFIFNHTSIGVSMSLRETGKRREFPKPFPDSNLRKRGLKVVKAIVKGV